MDVQNEAQKEVKLSPEAEAQALFKESEYEQQPYVSAKIVDFLKIWLLKYITVKNDEKSSLQQFLEPCEELLASCQKFLESIDEAKSPEEHLEVEDLVIWVEKLFELHSLMKEKAETFRLLVEKTGKLDQDVEKLMEPRKFAKIRDSMDEVEERHPAFARLFDDLLDYRIMKGEYYEPVLSTSPPQPVDG
ncbi:hypothetical protein K491DRAFT_741080 [Lophiostoma macrostomum CBS 122681]|uniref:Uncharacterized protein n=1 Tax=Lophiostoma macrostomum CBS 122681 TaxID=1314788 RepID=A0A6A6TF33_9PLEO|nr:hypothetical protein K491DRAFT_741080 [Lophiostoma macrostomum CBS 122681]